MYACSDVCVNGSDRRATVKIANCLLLGRSDHATGPDSVGAGNIGGASSLSMKEVPRVALEKREEENIFEVFPEPLVPVQPLPTPSS